MFLCFISGTLQEKAAKAFTDMTISTEPGVNAVMSSGGEAGGVSKQDETKTKTQNETQNPKRNETKRNETKRNETKRSVVFL
jgi:hypothetical protein